MRGETPDFITPDLWPPNSPGIHPVDYRVLDWMYYRNMLIGNLLKTERWWTEAASDWNVVWHPAMWHWSGNWPMASLP